MHTLIHTHSHTHTHAHSHTHTHMHMHTHTHTHTCTHTHTHTHTHKQMHPAHTPYMHRSVPCFKKVKGVGPGVRCIYLALMKGNVSEKWS